MNATILAGVLALGAAVYGCGSDDSGIDDVPDGGDGVGGSAGGMGGTGGFGNGGSGTQGGAGGGGDVPDGGVGGLPGSSGGSGMQQGGQGGMSMNNPDGGAQLQCVAGGMCTGDDRCTRACANNGTVTCVCVSGRLFCGNCERSGDAGMQMNPNTCPQNPQGAACDDEASPFCEYGSAQQNRGNCICNGDKYFCPSLPAPAGSPACPMNPNFKQCMTEGSICSQDQNRACSCRRLGMGANGLVWICPQ